MFNHTLLKRSLTTALVLGTTAFPVAAQAQVITDGGGGGSSPTSQSATIAPAPQPTADAQSGFQWGDAGIGAAGIVVLLIGGTGAASVVRRRAHRPVTH